MAGRLRGRSCAGISASLAGISIATAAASAELGSRHATVGGAQAAELPGEARDGSWTASAAGTGDAMPQSGGRVTGGGYALLCGARRAFEL